VEELICLTGVPVLTVAINNSTNAALGAARILGASDPRIRTLVEDYARNSKEEVLAKDAKLKEGDWRNYLSEMQKKS